MVPFLTLALGIDIQTAIAASLISIVATSSGAAAAYLKDHLTNLRLAVVLEIGTVTGAMTGFLLHRHIQTSFLFSLFGLFLLWSAWIMFRRRKEVHELVGTVSHPWADKLKLNGTFIDHLGQRKEYKVENLGWGIFSMYGAGVISALLGIGSGSLKVLAMDGAMKLPIRTSTATSNFMIGVTAAASAGAFMLEGKINPQIASPVAVGVLVGSMIGAKIMLKLPAVQIRRLFVIVLIIIGLQMVFKGIRGWQ